MKDNQSTHFAVLDVPVGSKDLQQCDDAILRLRAEYFFNKDNIDSIYFKATDGTDLSLQGGSKVNGYHLNGNRLVACHSEIFRGGKREQLEHFLEVVFSYCGTISLDKETNPVKKQTP